MWLLFKSKHGNTEHETQTGNTKKNTQNRQPNDSEAKDDKN